MIQRALAFGFAFSLAIAISKASAQTTCESLFRNVKPSPLVELTKIPDEPFPFRSFKAATFDRAIPEGLAIARYRLEAIRKDSRTPDLENTIEAMLKADEELNATWSILSNLTSLVGSKSLAKVEDKWRDEIQKLGLEYAFDPVLFARVKAVYERRYKLGLSREQMSTLVDMFKAREASAKLSPEQKKRVQEISERLGQRTKKFGDNNRDAAEKAFVQVDEVQRLEGLPSDVLAAAKELAEKQDKPNSWIISLKAATAIKVMTFAKDRGLREEIWRKRSLLGTVAPYDNRLVAIEIANLRHELASINGFSTYAHMKLEDRMAGNPENVLGFLKRMREAYRPAAEKDARELYEFALQDGYKPDEDASGRLRPWDAAFYSDRLKNARYQFDSELLRPYLSLEAVHQGSLRAAERLHRIKFVEVKGVDVWDPTVRVYEVREEKNGALIGLFYFDPYTRDGKRDGAWMNTLRDGGETNGVQRRPHVINVMNFAPPTKDQPTLLSIDEVRTIFHELGHGLHGLFSKTRYTVNASPNVAWDFVEFPSQLNEKWALDPATLRSFARHYQTGEVLPLEYIEKLRRAENFQVGADGLMVTLYNAIDMAWHMGLMKDVKTVEDLAKFEEEFSANYRVGPWSGRLITPTFNHIFSGGYAAGYYSYAWADVLVADAAEYFQATGLYNRKLAVRYRSLLSKGGTMDAQILYRLFRGQDADPKALLRSQGFED